MGSRGLNLLLKYERSVLLWLQMLSIATSINSRLLRVASTMIKDS